MHCIIICERPSFNKQDRFDPGNSNWAHYLLLLKTICWLIFTSLWISVSAKLYVNQGQSELYDYFFCHIEMLVVTMFLLFLCFPAKCLRAAPWRRSTWMGSPPPLAWWRWDGTRSWASASWRAARNRWWSALSRQVGSAGCLIWSEKLTNPTHRGFKS